MIQHRAIYYGTRIKTRIRSTAWCYIQWPYPKSSFCYTSSLYSCWLKIVVFIHITVGDSVVFVCFYFQFCTVPLYCLRRDSVTLISTLLLTYLRTSPSSRVGVSKASAFRFVSWTVYSPYPTLNLRRLSFSSRRCTDLEQSSAAYHICSVTSRLLLLLEDILLRTLLPVIVVPAKWHCHLWTR